MISPVPDAIAVISWKPHNADLSRRAGAVLGEMCQTLRSHGNIWAGMCGKGNSTVELIRASARH